MSKPRESYRTLGATGTIAVDLGPRLEAMQRRIIEATRHLVVDCDDQMPPAARLALPFRATPQETDWSQLMAAMNQSAELRDIVECPGVIAIFREIFGAEPERFPICRFRTLFPSNRRSSYDWHQDQGTWYVTNTDFQHLATYMPATMWLSINGASRENSIEIALRSHELPLLFHQVVPGQGAFHADLDRDPNQFEVVTVECEPGDCVVFHPLALHRTVPTMIPRPRYSIDIRYFDPNERARHPVAPDFEARRRQEIGRGTPA